MGAFLLVREGKPDFDCEAAVSIISAQCESAPVEFQLNGWKLWLFPKKLVSNINYRRTGNSLLLVTGTPLINGLGYDETIDEISGRTQSGQLDLTGLGGLFALIIIREGSLLIATDKYGLYSIFHDESGDVFSSSFLSVCAGLPALTPDRDSITENLLTGTLVGPPTLFLEINRLEPSQPVSFDGVTHSRNYETGYEMLINRGKEESISYQLKILDTWFSGFRKMVPISGIKAGITGGLDSRLLLALCRKHFRKSDTTFYAHARKQRDQDYTFGQELCKVAGMKFISREVKDIDDVSDDELPHLMNAGMHFNDGQIRTHSFWHEEFNTGKYVADILGDAVVSLNGIGGEQYRNMERMLLKRKKKNWIREELIIRMCGSEGAGTEIIWDVAGRLQEKIDKRLGISNNKIDLLYIKRYQNEVYNPSNRALRSVNENRLAFALNPFCDYMISEAAYTSIPDLGYSIDFEAGMIRKIDEELANVNSVYGFSFKRGEPFAKSFPRLVLNNFLPFGLKDSLMRSGKWGVTDRWMSLAGRKEYFENCLNKVGKLNLPVNINSLSGRTDLGPLLFALGHLILYFENKISLNEV